MKSTHTHKRGGIYAKKERNTEFHTPQNGVLDSKNTTLLFRTLNVNLLFYLQSPETKSHGKLVVWNLTKGAWTLESLCPGNLLGL